ncbi:MAG: hypothetical protein C5B51_10090 [Terriglobia bacterium]|nr:MAG: hypothetical protein C5B51_10090 [Terriglobia bacterium]
MSSRQNQRDSVMVRVREGNEKRALLLAKRIPWQNLATAADEYTDWVCFALWLRAVVDAAGRMPSEIIGDLKARVPHALEQIRLDLEKAAVGLNRRGTMVWQAVLDWAEMSVFGQARLDGWLESVRYFSSRSLASMKAWSHWENVDGIWSTAPPSEFPTYAEWQSNVVAVTCLSNAGAFAQQILEAVQSLPPAELTGHIQSYSDLVVFSLWMELMLDLDRLNSVLVATELENKYPGFRLSGSLEPKDAVRALHDWVIDRDLCPSEKERLVCALSYHVIHHPCYPAMRAYAQHCHAVWLKEKPDLLPSFDAWRANADRYIEGPLSV